VFARDGYEVEERSVIEKKQEAEEVEKGDAESQSV
jgi:hypothetical protein